jgi:hypothetical protein
MRWPRSKTTQSIIALALGLLAGVNEVGRFALHSFNDFYFGPHKAYPYPYADTRTADLVLARDCAVAFGIVFLAAVALQRLITRRDSN